MELEPRVIHLDDHLLVVDKPSGVLVHRGWGRDAVTLVDLARELSGDATVHPTGRLDRGTSGVIVLARSSAAARALDAATADSRVIKRYRALVRGQPPASGTIDHPIPRRPGGPRVPALTTFETLCTVTAEPRTLSWVEAELAHGRLHQVRRHLKHIDHPVIGDANYGKGALNREIAARYGLSRLALHCRELALPHPATGELLSFRAPLPADLAEPLERIGVPDELLG